MFIKAEHNWVLPLAITTSDVNEISYISTDHSVSQSSAKLGKK